MGNINYILAAPTSPVEAPRPEDWNTVEEQFGTLPDDFKAFVERFGSGAINHFPRVNTSIGGQANGYPLGYVPTSFQVGE